jgi:hypothetical protein
MAITRMVRPRWCCGAISAEILVFGRITAAVALKSWLPISTARSQLTQMLQRLGRHLQAWIESVILGKIPVNGQPQRCLPCSGMENSVPGMEPVPRAVTKAWVSS